MKTAPIDGDSAAASAISQIKGKVKPAATTITVGELTSIMALDPKQIQTLVRGIHKAGTDAQKNIQAEIDLRVNEAANLTIGRLIQIYDELEKKIIDAKRIEVTSDYGKFTVADETHMQFEELLRALSTSFPVMLVGSAGSGKTYAAEQVARAFGLNFFAQSVGSQTSQSHFLGYTTSEGTYVSTQFREAYEHGGIFCLDEIDAGNPNVLIVLNSALSSGFCAFPDAKKDMVHKHPDFKLVATANTYGSGANRKYVGRNQLDGATIDRFIQLDWKIDEVLEGKIVQFYPDGAKFHYVIREIRQVVLNNGYDILVTPRATIKGSQLLANGFTFEQALSASLLANVPKQHAIILEATAQRAWKGDSSV